MCNISRLPFVITRRYILLQGVINIIHSENKSNIARTAVSSGTNKKIPTTIFAKKPKYRLKTNKDVDTDARRQWRQMCCTSSGKAGRMSIEGQNRL